MERIVRKAPNGQIFTVRKNGTLRVQTDTTNWKEVTDQQFADQVDINEIVAKFQKTGQISHLNKMQGMIADVSEIPDLLESMQTVTRAQQTFAQLPAVLRDRFGNSPVQLINFLQDPANDQEAVSLGLKHFKAIETPLEDKIAQSYKKIEDQRSKKTNRSNDDDSNNDDRGLKK